jgi:hypothetical protein
MRVRRRHGYVGWRTLTILFDRLFYTHSFWVPKRCSSYSGGFTAIFTRCYTVARTPDRLRNATPSSLDTPNSGEVGSLYVVPNPTLRCKQNVRRSNHYAPLRRYLLWSCLDDRRSSIQAAWTSCYSQGGRGGECAERPRAIYRYQSVRSLGQVQRRPDHAASQVRLVATARYPRRVVLSLAVLLPKPVALTRYGLLCAYA